MDITDAMIEELITRWQYRPPTKGEARATLEAVLNMPEVRLAIIREELAKVTTERPAEDADVIEEPQEIGAKVIDREGDEWERTNGGWRLGAGSIPWPWASVRPFAPLRRVS